MFNITEQHTDFILADIKKRGVETEDLQMNLLDHICCMIENNLQPGESFEKYYDQLINTFFKKDLRELQEETNNLLTFKNYYAMKRTMNISGAISGLLIPMGAFFKIQHWPGAGVCLVLGAAIFCLVFLPVMFTLKLKESTGNRDKFMIVLGLLLSLGVVTGIIFKIQYWPYANMIQGTTLLFFLLIFIPFYFFTGIRNPLLKFNTIVTTILMLAGGGLLLSLTNQSISKRTQENLIGINDYLNNDLLKTREANENTFRMLANEITDLARKQKMEMAFNSGNELNQYIEEFKLALISKVENINTGDAKNFELTQSSNPNSAQIIHDFMAGKMDREYSLKELQQKLKSTELAYKSLGLETKWSENISDIHEDQFGPHLAISLHRLTQIQYDVAGTNSKALFYFKGLAEKQ